MKIRPMGAELFHADRQTDMTKLIVAFCCLSNAPINCVLLVAHISNLPQQCHNSKSVIFFRREF